jgi:hypothetical protein
MGPENHTVSARVVHTKFQRRSDRRNSPSAMLPKHGKEQRLSGAWYWTKLQIVTSRELGFGRLRVGTSSPTCQKHQGVQFEEREAPLSGLLGVQMGHSIRFESFEMADSNESVRLLNRARVARPASGALI